MKAPVFSLPDQNGKQVSLEQFKGKKVVLYFYPKADTPGCTAQACGLRDGKKVIEAMNAAIIGVSPDDVKDLKHFEKKYNLNFPLLADPERTVLNAYGVWREKSFMGRRFMGVERTTILIDEEGRIIRRYDGVNPLTHAGMIMSDLRGTPQEPAPRKKRSTGETNAKKTNTKNKKTSIASNNSKKKSKHNKKRAAANA